jgi:hypothetical protein
VSIGSSENCTVTKSKGTPSDQTACPGLMNVDLGALMMGNLQRSRDANLCVANSESRSTDKTGQQGAVRPNSNNEAENGASVQEFWSARVTSPNMADSSLVSAVTG